MISARWRARTGQPSGRVVPGHSRCRAWLRVDEARSGHGVGSRRVLVGDDRARAPRSFTKRAAAWLFSDGGISLVLLAGLLGLGLVGWCCAGG